MAVQSCDRLGLWTYTSE